MILDPINDGDCLGQLTVFARELAPSTLVRSVAARLGTREAVVLWFQSLPQTDDFGDERVRVIQCDVPQRARLFPDDPNCVERSLGALMLLEVLDPKTPRALATVDQPERHTGLVEKSGSHWRAVDLFPRRNARRDFSWDSFGKDALQAVHGYVGKPILKFYLGEQGGQVADAIGDQEDKWIGREKKKQPEKNSPPPPAGAQRASEQPKQEPKAQPEQQPATRKAWPARRLVARPVGAGANPEEQPAPAGAGGKDAQNQKVPSSAGPTAVDGAAAGAGEADEGSDRDSHDQGAEAQRFWRALGW
jgi:hypothetical protein